ncbi:hypothetical protein FFF34_009670 [Inquilinus sp. KBS0705]|nr:hypothetical protein FFF34_009670 [Inquilinus sp. KBS0705]
MSFWKTNNYSYDKVVEIGKTELVLLLNGLSREDMIEWLMWNDPNGVYGDDQSMKEFGNVMSKDEGMEIILRQAEDNRVVKIRN